MNNLDNLMIVDINKLKNNIQWIKEKTNKEIIAIIKSNAYGLGIKKIAKYLISSGVSFFAINKESEYEFLGKPILILNSVTNLINDSLVRYTINSIDDVYFFKKTNRKVIVHLQIDTGMNRLGIRTTDEYQKIILEINKCQNILIEGVFTHYSSGAEEFLYYEYQNLRFLEFLKIATFPIVHGAASSSLKKNLVGNFVRIGISMYGFCQIEGLKVVPRIMTPVIQTFFLKREEKFGYGQNKLKSDGYLNVIPLGYYEANDFRYVYYKDKNQKLKWHKLQVVGKSCMNHRHVYSKFAIKKLSYLYVFFKNDTIYKESDFYRFLTSTKQIHKIYLEVKNDLSTIFKRTNKKSIRFKQRRNCNQIINFGTIK